MITERDRRWLAAAMRLGQRGRPLSRPNPAVGAIIVKEGRVIGRGNTQAGGRPHAEAIALAEAGEAAQGSDIYVTLEPCAHRSERGPSCADLLLAALPARVIVGITDPDPRTSGQGIARLKHAGIDVLLADDAATQRGLAGYLIQKHESRPFVTLKLAASRDGRLSTHDPDNPWITGEIARGHVHAHRAQQDAILVGGETWRADNPQLDVRLAGLEHRSPARYVLTRSLAVDGAEVLASPQAIKTLDHVQYLYVEGGAQTADAFLKAGLVDRVELYRAPITIGKGRDDVQAIGLGDLDGAQSGWRRIEECQLGSDHFAAYQRCEA